MRKLLLAVAVLLLAWAAAVVPVPLAVLAPAQALPVTTIVEMEEGLDHDLPDEVRYTAVQLQQPTAIGAVLASFDARRQVTLPRAVTPPGVDEEQFVEFQRRLFEESVRAAVAMGLDTAGLEVSVSGDGARVVTTIPGGPADAVLQQEDVITAVDDRPVALASELAAILSDGDAGQDVALTFEREGEQRSETIELAALAEGPEPGRIGIGLLAATVDLQIDVPVEARPREDARIGGPSAGLMLALGTYAAASGTELAAGRMIAGSGTIDLAGSIGPVDGVEAKVRGADRAGAEVFLVPEALADEARAVAPDGLEVIAVGSLREAIDRLT